MFIPLKMVLIGIDPYPHGIYRVCSSHGYFMLFPVIMSHPFIDDVVSHFPLVMTNIAMEHHHAIKNGKPSINGPIFHGELLVITRG